MNRFQTLTIYAVLIIITGLVLIPLAYYPFEIIQNTITSGLFITSLFAFITAYKCVKLQIPFSYHLLHAICLAIYGVAIFIYAENIESFLKISAFFVLYYGMSEIVFGLQILMLKDKISFKTLAIRLALGLIIAFGGVIILTTSFISQINAMVGMGIVFVIMGLNLLLFKTVLRKLASQTNSILENKDENKQA